ncbi:UDP-N-acetylmuramoyl-L-alanine--D-glutamate ligase [Halomonas binhaiensis]|uniref:UDP-N-acetylmuramoylalanine--D-glutamate ligase n=1 Tax=Halomonas binhaiensis TaxID=2562282 RepID=A0A5C1NGK2_9GAMM|nr:UDP-N-acetylmuramoyl-L-alanine--D-glutamate ligase [Halomonas binhaiensis]QEM81345.1 UDP-N-acetylmuramoyl-L-alanine--D-glutamate ligase [Halomonas binhaiensis]
MAAECDLPNTFLPQDYRVPPGTTVVVGLGISGMAICRHLKRIGRRFMVVDTRGVPPGLDGFLRDFPDVALRLGPLDGLSLDDAFEVVQSPGVDPHHPVLAPLLAQINPQTGEPRLVGEIALFRRACQGRIAAITGANAKSTVTTLVGEMARQAGCRVAVGGNLGTAALDLLEDTEAELFVLELSSFQLETTPCLAADSAAFLNLSEDHLDRHGDMAGYRNAKLGIFKGAAHGVINADDDMTWPEAPLPAQSRFTLSPPANDDDWGIAEHNGQLWFAHGNERLMPVSSMKLKGRHHQANALAAMAMGHRLGLPVAVMEGVLKRFAGLAHRSEWIADIDGVAWINDSKGTNVGATIAAIAGLGPTLDGRLILLAGGVGKGADFRPLAEPLSQYAREAVVFGQDAERLCSALEGHVALTRVDTLDAAMEHAREIAEPGDAVLLSPACASLDQFANYLARGDAFRHWVKRFTEGDS